MRNIRCLPQPRPRLCRRLSHNDRRMIQGMIHLPQMYWLTAFGLLAVCLMLIFYANEKRSPWFVLAFAGSCVMGSAYGFLQGAWPFGLIEGVWSVVAIRRWYQSRIKFEPAPTICENNVNEFFAELQTVAKPAERGHYAFPGADGSINGFVQF